MKEFGENIGDSSDFHKLNINFMTSYTNKLSLPGAESISAKKDYFDSEKVCKDLIGKALELAKKDCIRSLKRDIAHSIDSQHK